MKNTVEMRNGVNVRTTDEKPKINSISLSVRHEVRRENEIK